jgi:hypothetical protein
MRELMLDLETLDVRSRSVVLSIGAVVWETHTDKYEIISKFYRVLNLDEQITKGRTVSQSTLLWWQQQDPIARKEAFTVERNASSDALTDLRTFIYTHGLERFWANPTTFDFPIIETLAEDFDIMVPWKYNQKYDVRTVVLESGLSVRDHVPSRSIDGFPHTPVFDCEWQIDVLHAARKLLHNH